MFFEVCSVLSCVIVLCHRLFKLTIVSHDILSIYDKERKQKLTAKGKDIPKFSKIDFKLFIVAFVINKRKKSIKYKRNFSECLPTLLVCIFKTLISCVSGMMYFSHHFPGWRSSWNWRSNLTFFFNKFKFDDYNKVQFNSL